MIAIDNPASDTELKLRDDFIVDTVDRLGRRIRDRFPTSGLATLCDDLLRVARRASERSRWISRPIIPIRWTSYGLAAALIALMIASIVYAIRTIDADQVQLLDLVSALEAGINEVIFLAIAIVFLITWETRIKRRRALSAIHELRSIAHIIDMHQLTKDPERLLRGWSNAEHSPRSNLTPLQLNRYLDYCTEMLSLTGKIAALYVQDFDDADAVNAVSEVEELTTGLSRKIWQKIVMLGQLEEQSRLIDYSVDKSSPASE